MMTVDQAIADVRRIGTLSADAGRLNVHLPRARAAEVADALEVLRARKPEVLKKLRTDAPPLKGRAVELWCRDGRIWLVADEADAQEVIRRFEGTRGECVTTGELELIGRIHDQASRDEVLAFKRELNGTVDGYRRESA